MIAKQVGKKRGKSDSGIEVKGVDNCLVRLSRCCNPVPGDDIIGFITRGRGVSVHRCDCINVLPENITEEQQKAIENFRNAPNMQPSESVKKRIFSKLSHIFE